MPFGPILDYLSSASLIRTEVSTRLPQVWKKTLARSVGSHVSKARKLLSARHKAIVEASFLEPSSVQCLPMKTNGCFLFCSMGQPSLLHKMRARATYIPFAKSTFHFTMPVIPSSKAACATVSSKMLSSLQESAPAPESREVFAAASDLHSKNERFRGFTSLAPMGVDAWRGALLPPMGHGWSHILAMPTWQLRTLSHNHFEFFACFQGPAFRFLLISKSKR